MSLLLNSRYLRQLGAPIRRAAPGVYDRLNSIRKSIIVGTEGIEAYHALALERFGRIAPIRDARVLEIGSDLEMRVLGKLVKMGTREAIGVNVLASPQSRQNGQARLVQADAHELPFEADTFDYVFSVATFEHITDLPRAFAEMHRVLRPGGMLFAEIGPIWSGGTGHHLYAVVGQEEARFFKPEKNPLPDFCHLLLAPEELRQALVGRTSPALLEPIVAWVYDSPHINRLFYRDYIRIFNESKFRVESVVPARDPVDPQLERILRFRYPGEDSFDVTNMTAVFVKER